jgi:hypothetical protein
MKTYKVTIDESGTTRWYNANNKLHREDGPAVEWANGDKFWYINDKRHRENGPAVEWSDGSKYWFLNDKQISEEGFNNRKNKPCIGKKVIIDGTEYTLK